MDYEQNLKKALSKMLEEAKTKKALEEETRKAKNEADRSAIFESVGKDLGQVINPYLDKLTEHSRMSAEELKRIISEAVHVEVPSIDTNGIQEVLAGAFSNLKFPTPQVHVKVPEIKVPEVKVNIPESMKVEGEVSLPYDKKSPLPVQMMDSNGKPMMFPISAGGGGGRGDFFTIKDIQTSAGLSIIDNDGFVKVTGSFSVSSTPFATYYASDAVGSMNLIQVGGNAVVVGSGYQDNAIRVVNATDAVTSVNVVGFTASIAANLSDSGGVGYSGSNPLPVTIVSGGSATTGSAIVDSSGVQYSGSNPVPISNIGLPVGEGDSATAQRIIQAGDSVSSVVVNSGTITTVTTLTGVTNSVQSSIIDSSGVQYSGSNPVPVTLISGALTSTLSVGDSAARTADNGGNPVKVGGIARTTNPTAFANGDRSNFSSDKLGRQLMRPVQVRDLIKTAYVSLTNGTETTLLAAVAGAFLDCIYLSATNNSTAATQLDIRSTTAGNIVHTMYLPASTGPVGWSLSVPWPQDNQGNNWTVDMPDQTGTTVYISALFSQEV